MKYLIRIAAVIAVIGIMATVLASCKGNDTSNTETTVANTTTVNATTYADDNSNQVSTHQYINETKNNQDEKTLTLTELSSIFSLNLDEHIFNVETFNQEELSSSVNNYSCKTVFNKSYYDTFIKLLNDSGYHSFDIVNRKHDVSVFNEETGLSIDYQKVVSGYHYFKTVVTDDKTPVMIRRRFIVLVEQRNSSLYNAYFFVY